MAPNKTSGPPEKSDSSMIGLMVCVVIVSLVAAAAGTFSGWQFKQLLAAPRAKPSSIVAANIETAGATQILQLATIVSNLAADTGWVRISAVAVIADTKPVPPDLGPRLAQDIIAVLRTISLKNLSSAVGFQTLREEILDRLRTRSDGRVKDIILESLVIE